MAVPVSGKLKPVVGLAKLKLLCSIISLSAWILISELKTLVQRGEVQRKDTIMERAWSMSMLVYIDVLTLAHE
jgi:hypothetical protein